MGFFAGDFRFPVFYSRLAQSASSPRPTQRSAIQSGHLFADNVRFLSMAAIVFIHTADAYPYQPLSQRYLAQPFKFGTIAFFLVAGFLFGERIDQYSSKQYYARRLKNVFLPWSIWYLLYAGLHIGSNIAHGRLTLHSAHPLSQLWLVFSNSLLDTAYWFVPNLLVALGVLLLFRRVLRDARIGAAFFAVTLVYAANIYGHWFPAEHTRAVFGFVFYLWLGAWAAWHFEALEKWLLSIPVWVVIGLVVATNALALGEAMLLASLHSVDPMNSLRITNQISSVVVVLAIVRVRQALWPRFVDVRAHTFGLYLTHTVALTVLDPILIRVMPRIAPIRFWSSVSCFMALLLVMFVFIYGSCLILVRGLLMNRWLRWTVGVTGRMRSGSVGSIGADLRQSGQSIAALPLVPSKNLGSLAGDH